MTDIVERLRTLALDAGGDHADELARDELWAIGGEEVALLREAADEIERLRDPSNWCGVWHVRHADGTIEDIQLDQGNLLEDMLGPAGQFLLVQRPRS